MKISLLPTPYSPLPKIRQAGFGLMEVLVAAVVLAFLLVGLNTMQKGNREAVLRIRTRDAAQIIAQDFLDSLSSLGILSIPATLPDKKIDYKWKGNKGIEANIEYTIKATISENKVTESSQFDNIDYTTSKNIVLTVSWPFKNTTQSISMTRIIK